jgi:hypothetical protein
MPTLEDFIPRKFTLEEVEAIQTLDFDYYTCHTCKKEMTNFGLGGGRFFCTWCSNGCDSHGDIFIRPGNTNRKISRKAKEWLVNHIKENK